MKLKMVAVLALAVLMVSPALAQDEAKGKKKKNAKKGGGSSVMQLIKALEPVGLTEEQTNKIKEMGKMSTAALDKMKEEAGITKELTAKRTAAMKELKDSGKKGKDMVAAITEKAGLNEAQAAAFAKLNSARQKFQREVVGMLTEEQKGKLPEKMKRLLKAPGKKGGAKKKKKAE